MIMVKVNVHEAKTHLSRILDQACSGEKVIICRNNVPIAELKPLPTETEKKIRRIGLGAGTAVIHDSFFEPLPDDILDSFENPM